MKNAQKIGGQARNLAMSLKALRFSSELVSQLEAFAKCMEKIFSQLQSLVLQDSNDESDYTAVMELYTRRCAWYAARERAAKAMLAGASKSLP